MKVHTLPASVQYIISSGDLGLRLARHRTEPRMTPLLMLTDTTGRVYVAALTIDDVVRLFEDLRVAFGADARTVTDWWQALQSVGDEDSQAAAPSGAPEQ